MNETPSTRVRIHELAKSLLHQHGVYFVFQQLEDGAGAGTGGLRHYFRNRDAVVAAFANEEFDQKVGIFMRLSNEPDAGAALEEWAYHVAEWMLQTYGLADLMIKAIRNEKSALHELAQDMIKKTDPMVQRADTSEWLRGGIIAEEFVVAVLAAAAAADSLVGGPPPTTLPQRIVEARLHIENLFSGIKYLPEIG